LSKQIAMKQENFDQQNRMGRSNTFFDETFAAPDLFASFTGASNDDEMNTTPSTGSTPELIFGMFDDLRTSMSSRIKKQRDGIENENDVYSVASTNVVEKNLRTSKVKKIVKKKTTKKKNSYRPTNLKLIAEDAIEPSKMQQIVYQCDDINRDDQRDAFSQEPYDISSGGSLVFQDMRIGYSGITEYPQTLTQSQPMSPQTIITLDSPVRQRVPRTPPTSFHTNKDNKTIKYENLVELQTLGSGASSSVTLVKDTKSGILYAKKTVKVGYNLSPKLINSEVKALHRCRTCSHIISFYDAFYRDDKIHIILEYMDGNSLEAIQHKVGQVPEEMLAIMSWQVLKALQYLHNKRIVHRDIKPANILIKKNGEVKISDFGLTGIYSRTLNQKQLEEKQNGSANHYGTKNPMVWQTCQGTILYMSPERIQEQPHTFNSDIWSLGLTLAELRMGRYPFTNTNSYFDIIAEIKRLEQGAFQLPGDLFSPIFTDFVKNCMIVDQNQRPSAAQLMQHEWIMQVERLFQDEAHMKGELAKWMANTVRT
jgi:hypothetical protein